jgi:hypothetical protein
MNLDTRSRFGVDFGEARVKLQYDNSVLRDDQGIFALVLQTGFMLESGRR